MILPRESTCLRDGPGRLHESVAELEPKVQQVQASVGALRADLRADLGALSASSAKLNDKMDQLLLSFLVCQSPNRQQSRRRRAKAAPPRRAATPWTPPELDATPNVSA